MGIAGDIEGIAEAEAARKGSGSPAPGAEERRFEEQLVQRELLVLAGRFALVVADNSAVEEPAELEAEVVLAALSAQLVSAFRN